jgi:hypothetical protein
LISSAGSIQSFILLNEFNGLEDAQK